MDQPHARISAPSSTLEGPNYPKHSTITCIDIVHNRYYIDSLYTYSNRN